MDLYRHSLDSNSNSNANADIDMRADTDAKFFSIDGGATQLTTFSTGVYNGNGDQASHWQDNLNIGMMDPTAALGELVDMTALDVLALDVIGWDAGIQTGPTITGPASGTVDTTPTFTWDAVPLATHYELWVNEIDFGGQTVTGKVVHDTNIQGLSFTPTTPIPHSRYTVSVRAFNAVGDAGPWTNGYIFDNVATPTGTPTITAPGSGGSDPTPTFSWTAVDASLYELWVNQIDNAGNVIEARVIHEVAHGSTSFTPTTDLPAGRYRVWARGQNVAQENGPWSAAHTFTIVPLAPSLIGPSGSTTDNTPTFTWNEAPGATRYELWVNEVNASGQLITPLVIHNTQISTTSYTDSGTTLSSGHYRFWVRAFNELNEAGAWSLSMDFTVL